MGPEAALGQGNTRAAHQDQKHDSGQSSSTMAGTSSQREEHKSQTAAAAAASAADEPHTRDSAGPYLQLSDFLGDHGAYQMSLTLLLFVRYVLLGLMASSGPLMTPDVTFYCKLPEREIAMIMPNLTLMSEQERELELKEEFKQICQIDLNLYKNQSHLLMMATNNSGGGGGSVGNSQSGASSFKTTSISAPSSGAFLIGKPAPPSVGANATTSGMWAGPNSSADMGANQIRECTEFTYQLARDQGRTMTSEFDLVCDRDWLRSLFQSLLSAAIVLAHVFWGTFSDKYGRFQAQRICLIVSFAFGLSSIFAWDFWSFALARALCSFGDLGLVVSMTTTLVELVGSKYRGCSVALVNFGYALGVSLLPYLVAYFEDFRLLLGFTVLCHMITMPLVLATNESVRWLLTNRRFKSAKRELKRIARWNRRLHELQPVFGLCSLSAGSRSREERTGPTGDSSSSSCPADKRSQKRALELKFEEFIRQIESQNLCDPVVAEQGGAPPSDCPSPRVGSYTPTRPLRPAARYEAPTARDEPPAPISSLSFPSPGVSHLAQRGWFFGTPPLIITTPPDAQTPDEIEADASPPKPRLLERLDLEQLRRIKEVEDTSAAGAPDTPGGRRARTHSFCLLNDALIKSLEMRHQQRLLDDSPRVPAAAAAQPGYMKTLTLPSPRLGRSSLSRASSMESQLSGIGRAGPRGASGSSTGARREYAIDHYARAASQKPPDCINLVAHQLSFVGRVSRLFKDKKLMIAVFTIVFTTFNSELLYTSFIIINLEVGDDLYLNYVLGGCMEALAAIAASLLLSYAPRRISLIAFWLLISLACFGLSLAHIDSTWAVWMLALAKFSQSCLSSIATVAAYESFPTFLRQSGSGLVFTLGMLGSVFAPLIFAEFDDHAGMDRVLMTFSGSSLAAATLIYLCLNETRNCELM